MWSTELVNKLMTIFGQKGQLMTTFGQRGEQRTTFGQKDLDAIRW